MSPRKLKPETVARMDASLGASQQRQLARLEQFKAAREIALSVARQRGHDVPVLAPQRRPRGAHVGHCSRCSADLWLLIDLSSRGEALEKPCP